MQILAFVLPLQEGKNNPDTPKCTYKYIDVDISESTERETREGTAL